MTDRSQESMDEVGDLYRRTTRPYADMVVSRELPAHEREFIARNPDVFIPDNRAGRDEPRWADLTRPAPAPGIVSAVPPATETASPVTRSMLQEMAQRIMADAAFSPTSDFRPRRTGDMMEVIGRLVERAEEAGAIRFVLAPAKWHAIMARATEDERVLLERAKDEGRIILSEYLPEPETAYRIQVPREYRITGTRQHIPWFLR